MSDVRVEEKINDEELTIAAVADDDMHRSEPMLADYSEALSWRLDTFKPSDREVFRSALQDPERNEAARFAVKLYLMHWAEADWHDDSVRRLGKWIGKNANEETKTKLAVLLRRDEHPVYKTFVRAMENSVTNRM